MREKFEALDGLRGLAAFCVVVFHRRAWFTDGSAFEHAYLAVDFFFMLSGFVIAYAYEDRLNRKHAFLPFMRERVIRLHPMLILGSILGMIVMLAEVHVGRTPEPAHPLLVYAFSLVPLPVWWVDPIFPLNMPTWSLFWELIANIIFALLAKRLTNRLILAIIAASLTALIYKRIAAPYLWGEGFTLDAFFYGLPRVSLLFFMGVGLLRIYRANKLAWLRMKWSAVALLVATLALSLPIRPVIFEMLACLLAYPVIILSVARWKPKITWPAQLSGALSYPVYILHEPVLKLISAALILTHISAGDPGPIEGAARILGVVMVSWLCMKLYDEPVRRWLKARFSARRQA